jgi:hypothetical protein
LHRPEQARARGWVLATGMAKGTVRVMETGKGTEKAKELRLG